jgi:hypothetical protein
MKYIKKNVSKIALLALAFSLPILSFGQAVIPPVTNNDGKITNPINASSIDVFIKTILQGVLKIGIPIIALAIIYCGFLFVAARGNSEKITKAKDALLYTLIGAAILLGAWAIAQLISTTVLNL